MPAFSLMSISSAMPGWMLFAILTVSKVLFELKKIMSMSSRERPFVSGQKR